MSTAKHTPGPWRVEENTTLIWGKCNPNDQTSWGMGYPIAECRITPISQSSWATGPNEDEGEANACLIAAAPDMLDALKVTARGLEGEFGPRVAEVNFPALYAAMAKAEGRP
jgi:hypothetical protein